MGETSLPSSSIILFFALGAASLVTVGLLFRDTSSSASGTDNPTSTKHAGPGNSKSQSENRGSP
jgi:hypothetical protein